MLDVHAPEHPIHGVREFFIHLFTITVGLLIALGLENLAEWRHHVHVRHQAEANMRREIETNRTGLRAIIAHIPAEEDSMKLIAEFLQARSDGKAPATKQMAVGISEATLEDASWNTASATGALSYMDYDEVQRFSAAYQLQAKFDMMQNQATPSYVGVYAAFSGGDPTQMKPADAADALRSVRMSIAQLEAVRGLATDLDRVYTEALKPE